MFIHRAVETKGNIKLTYSYLFARSSSFSLDVLWTSVYIPGRFVYMQIQNEKPKIWEFRKCSGVKGVFSVYSEGRF